MLRVLGSLQAKINGRTVGLGTSRQRAVVARLVAAGGHVVSTDRFIDDLWRGQPPPKAPAGLQVYVSNLRRALEPGRLPRTPATVLISAAPGYRLRLEPEQVDAWLFPRLIDAAGVALSAGDGARALEAVDRALALWQGPAYAEFADDECGDHLGSPGRGIPYGLRCLMTCLTVGIDLIGSDSWRSVWRSLSEPGD